MRCTAGTGTLLGICLLLAARAGAVEFTERVLQTDFLAVHSVQVARLDGSPHLLIAGEDSSGEQRLQIADLAGGDRAGLVLPLPGDLVALDISASANGESIYFLSPRGLERMDLPRGERVLVLAVQSLYRLPRKEKIALRDFLRDADGDGIDDLLLPDFGGLVLARGLGGGRFAGPQELPAPLGMTLSDEVVRYALPSVFVSDANFDGLTDILVLEDRRLRVFPQQAGGTFAAEARELSLGLQLPSEAQLRAWEDGGGDLDQSNLSIRRIERLTDLDGDGIVDLLAEVTHSSGVFDKRSDFEVHLGRQVDGWVRYQDPADSVLVSEGIRLDLMLEDLDDDGDTDIIVPSMRIGLGRIIRALFSGNIGMQLDFFRLEEGGTYPATANFSTSLKVRFDLTSGQVDVPAIGTGDFDGDGLKDLLVQNARDSLEVSLGDGSPGLFRGPRSRFDATLPRNGSLVEVLDVDGDRRSDLVIRYGNADGAERARTVRVLLAR